MRAYDVVSVAGALMRLLISGLKVRALPGSPSKAQDAGWVSAGEAAEPVAAIDLVGTSAGGQLEGLDELVRRDHLVRLARLPARRHVLQPLALEDDHARRAVRLHHVLIHEAFLVELAKDERFPRTVVTEERPVLMDFALGVLLLRRIRRDVLLVQETVVQDEPIGPLDGSLPRLPLRLTLPRSDHEADRRPRIRRRGLGRRGGLHDDGQEQSQDHEPVLSEASRRNSAYWKRCSVPMGVWWVSMVVTSTLGIV